MDLYKKLQECTCIGDAQPYIRKAKPALRELVESGVMFNNASDRQTKALGQRFIAKAVQEMEGDEHKMKEDTAYNHQGGSEDVEKKTKEVMEEHARDSEGSSSDANPLPKEGSEAPEGDIEGMDSVSNTDKIGGDGAIDSVSETNPLAIAGVDGKTMNEIAGGRQYKLPTLTTRQILRIINYNVNEALKPYRRVIMKHQEAIIAYGKQLQETKIKSGSMKLDMDSLRKNATVKEYNLRETSPEGIPQADGQILPFQKVKFTNMKLQETHNEIMALDEQLSNEKTSQRPYQ
jgi:hypothetical protein